MCVWEKSCCKRDKHFTETFQLLNQAYGRKGKGFSRPEKSTDESVKDQGVGFFKLQRHCPSLICTTCSVGKQTVVPGNFSAFQGRYAQEEAWNVGKPDLDVAPRQCTGSRLASYLHLSDKNQTSVVPHPLYSPDLAPADFFLLAKLKTTFNWRRFQAIVTLSSIRRTACARAQFSGLVRRLMLIAKRDQLQFVVKTWR